MARPARCEGGERIEYVLTQILREYIRHASPTGEIGGILFRSPCVPRARRGRPLHRPRGLPRSQYRRLSARASRTTVPGSRLALAKKPGLPTQATCRGKHYHHLDISPLAAPSIQAG